MRARHIIYIIVALLLAACQDNGSEYMFDKSVNERFDEKKTEIIKTLNTPEFGWIGNYNRNGDVGSNAILFKFIENNQVVIQSDYRYEAKNDTITYRIDKTLKIELIFETHSVLHEIYEINNNDSGGEFVFNITSVGQNEVVLTSKSDNGYNGEEVTDLVLNVADEESWDMGPLYESETHLIGTPTDSFFRNILHKDTPIAGFTYNQTNRTVQIYFIENGEVVKETYQITITKTGFNFFEPIVIKNVTIEGFTFNEEDQIYEDQNSETTLIYELTPPYTHEGIVDDLLSADFYAIDDYSYSLRPLVADMQNAIPSFRNLQLYMQRSWILCYSNPPHDGANKWAGFSNSKFTKLEENKLYINTEELSIAFAMWFYDIYRTNAGAYYLMSFLWDTEGFWVVENSEDTFYLVSVADPSKYILVAR